MVPGILPTVSNGRMINQTSFTPCRSLGQVEKWSCDPRIDRPQLFGLLEFWKQLWKKRVDFISCSHIQSSKKIKWLVCPVTSSDLISGHLTHVTHSQSNLRPFFSQFLPSSASKPWKSHNSYSNMTHINPIMIQNTGLKSLPDFLHLPWFLGKSWCQQLFPSLQL